MNGKEFIDLCKKYAKDDSITVRESEAILSNIKKQSFDAFSRIWLKYGWLVRDKFGLESDFDLDQLVGVNVATDGDTIEFMYEDNYETDLCFRFSMKIEDIACCLDFDYSKINEEVKEHMRFVANDTIKTETASIAEKKKEIERCELLLRKIDSLDIDDAIREYNTFIDDAI